MKFTSDWQLEQNEGQGRQGQVQHWKRPSGKNVEKNIFPRQISWSVCSMWELGEEPTLCMEHLALLIHHLDESHNMDKHSSLFPGAWDSIHILFYEFITIIYCAGYLLKMWFRLFNWSLISYSTFTQVMIIRLLQQALWILPLYYKTFCDCTEIS
jgi:hypothetical protein